MKSSPVSRRRTALRAIALETPGSEDLEHIHALLERHAELTGSEVAKRLLRTWRRGPTPMVKVMPEEYRRALRAQLELVS